ncbi:unnamed protein product [Chrysoparadoxa australica]
MFRAALTQARVARGVAARALVIPQQRNLTLYASSHEWVKIEGEMGTVGISDFAQQALGDVVYAELPDVGENYEKGDSFGSVESVKAASDVYLPVSGEVVEANEALSDEPGLVNTSPDEEGWFVKIKIADPSELDSLMDADAYKAHCDSS